MNKYFYFPILKTKPSEIRAFKELDEYLKDHVLPIIEMTGARSYTYPKNYKNAELIGKKRPGDINTKRKTILDMVGTRKFILDITDDISLRYDGIEQLQDSTNGYSSWIKYLSADDKFKNQVIPTIQFNTEDLENTFLQVSNLEKEFQYLALKLPGFIFETETINDSRLYDIKNITANDMIQSVIDKINDLIGEKERLIVIVDFGYIKDLKEYEECILSCITNITNLKDVKALLFSSSSFPSYVKPIEENEMDVQEIKLFNLCRNILKNDSKVLHCDFASIHPVQYQTNGGGWIPRIDYIYQNNQDLKYCYKRAASNEKYKNDSEEYKKLARKVINASNYKPIENRTTWGDVRISAKADGDEEGKAPSYWISVRANLYMTRVYDIMVNEEYDYSFLSL